MTETALPADSEEGRFARTIRESIRDAISATHVRISRCETEIGKALLHIESEKMQLELQKAEYRSAVERLEELKTRLTVYTK
jgi:hypothetical protein